MAPGRPLGTMTDMAGPWGLAQPGFSNGAAYVDLDNDGALDLVVNNINAPAAIYKNRARATTANHFLQVQLQGSGGNTAGVGAKMPAYTHARARATARRARDSPSASW